VAENSVHRTALECMDNEETGEKYIMGSFKICRLLFTLCYYVG
jgi:hypothetical protein